ncbi:MAG: sulfatase-like hydrolase/transferase [Bacteroidales bacterium]|nr:sulfatase-like hydrolase/transferase [Bacteroidales bacterium]MDD4218453.1 sulfatase-like hydrolase/transferase [Bacteroidales bacterium]MDY0143115.1 sulfatase-like hydrolase/transferase [Bacteroidales bacterium]
MKAKKFLIYLYYLLFWLFFFEIARIYFLLFNLKEADGAGFWNICASFIHGFRLDLSMVSYIGFFAIPLFIFAAFFKSHKVLKISLDIFTGILIAVFSLIIIGDAEVYKYWGFRLDDTPLQYMNTPGIINSSTSNWRFVLLVFLYLDLALGMFWIYYLFIGKKIKKLKAEKFWAAFYLLIAGLLIIPIRGGVGIAPINTGSAYFSDNMFLNHAGINVVWNSGASLFADEIDFKSYEYFDEDELNAKFKLSQQSPDSVINVLNAKPKKIIFVILESFAEKPINLKDPKNSVTKKLLEHSDAGILFTDCYSNGDRSEKGIVSIFSSVPALPGYSVMKDPRRSRKLPSLITKLVENGYKSSFYYGGDINFSNMNSYLKHAGFQNIISSNNLEMDCYETKWGYHDECMFNLFFNDIRATDDTSVFVLFTLSSHEPYDVPVVGPYGNKTELQRSQNAYYYTDSCLNVFLTDLENSPDWDNSLVILVSDHGSRYGGVEVWDKQKFHIYMLWTGGAISCEPFVYDQTLDQSDISASLLSQLGINHDEFVFSEDVFSKYVPNAFFAFNHGYGFIKYPRWVVYDINTKNIVYRGWDSEKLDDFAKAYAQKLAEYYKELGE